MSTFVDVCVTGNGPLVSSNADAGVCPVREDNTRSLYHTMGCGFELLRSTKKQW